MSRGEQLLAALAERGISVVFDGAQLRVGPRSALSPALIARIVECKDELVAACGGRHRPACRAGRTAPTASQPPPDRPTADAAARAPALRPAERWLLWTLAAEPGLTRGAVHAQVERALDLLLERREVCCGAGGGLVLGRQ